MNKILLSLLLVLPAQAAEVFKELEAAPCAVVVMAKKGTQVIPTKGKILTQFSQGLPLACGSMVITHQDAFWIRLSDQVTIKLAPESFFEISPSASSTHQLLRGSLMLSGAPGVQKQTILTPNARVEFTGGVSWMQYQPTVKTTELASFDRSSVLQNKFLPAASQQTKTGELSRLVMATDRMVPSPAEVMSPSSVKNALAPFGLEAEELSSLVEVTEKVFENRAKSMVSELEEWKSVQSEGGRTPASQAALSIEEKEAESMMKIMKERLYGSSADLKTVDQEFTDRKPASQPKLADPLYQEGIKKKQAEVTRILEAVSDLE